MFDPEEVQQIMMRQMLTLVTGIRDSIWEQDDDLEEDREDDENVIQPLIPKTLHTTPPNKDYVEPTTKSILDDILKEFRDEILNVTMVDKRSKCNPAKDIEELKRLSLRNLSQIL
ncbi:hypothetical protein Tco_0308168 [Tanacetum coccineum]